MSRRTPLRALLIAGALLLTFAAQANAQATRTWVSGVGDDVNPCSRTAPCKTFAGAISNTAAGGEINVLDPGGFGAVTITKAITIDAVGATGGVANSFTNGVLINAGATDAVVLRGLDIHGAANVGAACGYGGLSGVRILKAGSVRIEDTTISRQQKGIDIASTSPVNVFVNRVDMSENCVSGILAAPSGAGSAKVTVSGSTISNSGTALRVADNATAWLTGSTLFANTLAREAVGTGVLNDFGDNRLSATPTTARRPTTSPRWHRPVRPAPRARPAPPAPRVPPARPASRR